MDEKELLAQFGKLALEHETHLLRLRDTEQKMMQVKQQLIELQKEEK